MPKQDCLLLEDPTLCSLYPCLDLIGWHPHIFDLDETTQATQLQEHCSMGIIHSHMLSPTVVSKLSSLLSELSDINWILVTTAEVIDDNAVKTFVCNHCRYLLITNTSDPYSNAKVKPELKTLMEQGFAMHQLRNGLQDNPDELELDIDMPFGNSEQINALMTRTAKAAQVDAPVLIIGESGTGKELIAHKLHKLSARADKPFVAINCGAIPDSLIQSELFGYEQGAFTGANKRHIGKLEQAQHGTLFLDEIAELPMNLQVNLLRFLQEKTIERLGGSKSIKLDVRIVAATHENLEESIKKDLFREDLFYRLAVLQVCPPPLRQRTEDIPLLANHFLKDYSSNANKPLSNFSDSALKAMDAYLWPGNVRELMNRVQSAVVMSDGDIIEPEDLGLSTATEEEPNNVLNFEKRAVIPLNTAKQLAEAEAIKQALLEHNHNISKASKNLKISRASMYRLMQKYELM